MKNQIIIGGILCSVPLFSHVESHAEPLAKQQPKQPNIIFILADDMRGATLEFLGKESVLTPNLNRLAADGLTFTNAHIMGGTSGAVSMPSRAMLMTGKYLHQLTKNGAVIPTSDATIGEALGDAGYQTYHIGKWHSDRASFNRTFSGGKDIFFGGMADHWNVPLYSYDPTGNYEKKRPVIAEPNKNNKVEFQNGEYMYSGKHSVDIFTDAAIDFVTNKRSDRRPFFLYVAYMSPHDPRSMPDKYLNQYNLADIKLPENFLAQHPFNNGELVIRDEVLAAMPRIPEEVKEQIMSYYAMITHLDDNIGRLIEQLKQQGLYENTVIIFAADNGLAVGQHGLMGKQNVYEHSVNVPLIIKQSASQQQTALQHADAEDSATKRSNAKSDETPRTTDKMCYLIDLFPTLCDIASVTTPQSVEGVSLMPVLRGDKAVREQLYYGYRDFQRAVTDGTWKLIEYHVKGVRTTQLFNLKNDPMECKNLSADAQYTSQVQRLRKLMTQQKEITQDNSTFWKSFNY